MYTIHDICVKEIEYTYKYKQGKISYETLQGLIFYTNDGNYQTTYPDHYGYCYWTDAKTNTRIGDCQTDYVFGNPEGKIDAVQVLNKIINTHTNSY